MSCSKIDYERERDRKVEEIEDILKNYLPRKEGMQKVIMEAMEYSLMAGGKRLRPMLMQETYRLFGGESGIIEPFMAAIEMVHTYSLVHDDLPAMDNDALRRGRPTSHIVYGEATAILAGDGLLTAAFGQLAAAQLPAERIVAAVACLSQAAGPEGMVGGQALDMAGEGRGLTRQELELLQELKTGALIEAAARLGCIAAGGSEEQLEQVTCYAKALGRAFQVRDDVLERRRATEQTAFDPVEARPGEYRLPGGFGLRLRLVEGDDCEETIKFAQRAKKPFDNCADYDKISSSLCLRTRQPGDVYRPAGRNVDKTLKKLFNEKKEPAFRRGALPLLAAGSRVVWLWGEGFAHGLRPDGGTRRLLVVEPWTAEEGEDAQ